MPFILGVAVLILLLWAADAFSKVDPKLAAPSPRFLGGVVALLLAVFLMARGEIMIAAPLGVLACVLLGWISMQSLGRAWRNRTRVSRVRTAFLEMELDPRSGAMRGRILAGRHEGTALDALDPATLVGLLGQIDGDSRDLLAAYLDRRAPHWREYAKADAAAGGGGGTRTMPRGEMTKEEAYQILGVEPGADANAVGRAHRTLIKKLHPDQGGSTYLAARVNEAKDVLLRRHR
jgi:DnaJ domain